MQERKGVAAITSLNPVLVTPQEVRVLVHDVTYQRLPKVMSHSSNGVLAVADELAGMIASWGSQGQEAARGFVLTAWNGNDPYVVDRVECGPHALPAGCAALPPADHGGPRGAAAWPVQRSPLRGRGGCRPETHGMDTDPRLVACHIP